MIRNINYAILGNENTTRFLNRLKKSDILYPLLSKLQELELIAKYRDDRDKLNELLILHNMKVVFNIAKKYANKTDDFDSLVQDGMVGLAEAAKRFDIDAGVKFITYAHIWVKKYVLSSFYAKNIEVDKNSTSLNSSSALGKDMDMVEFEDYVNEYVDPSYGGAKDIIDEISSNECVELCKSLMKQLDNDSSLSATDKMVFTDIFYNREKTIDIADKYKITKLQVLDTKHRILLKFRNILASDYEIRNFYEI